MCKRHMEQAEIKPAMCQDYAGLDGHLPMMEACMVDRYLEDGVIEGRLDSDLYEQNFADVCFILHHGAPYFCKGAFFDRRFKWSVLVARPGSLY